MLFINLPMFALGLHPDNQIMLSYISQDWTSAVLQNEYISSQI